MCCGEADERDAEIRKEREERAAREKAEREEADRKLAEIQKAADEKAAQERLHQEELKGAPSINWLRAERKRLAEEAARVTCPECGHVFLKE